MNILLKFLFNLKERLYHRTSAFEIKLISDTNLFSHLDEGSFKKILDSIRLIKYSKSKLIFREGEQGDALYIIAYGSVRVFTYDIHNVKIPLARLNQGNYFGEQALLGQANKTRNANIETITDTTLIQITEKFLSNALKIDPLLKIELQESGVKQALNVLSLSTEFYNELDLFVSRINNPKILGLTNEDLIFNIGDKPDNVYFIIQGEVKLLIPDKNTNKFSSLILHKGHLFGELGVLKNKPRAATALAHGNARILIINGEDFKRYASKSKQLQQLLENLQKIYQIPMKGTVEQYVGNVRGIGNAITNIYKMQDGRSIISSKLLHQEIFTMSTANLLEEKHCKYERGGNKIELGVRDNRLTEIKAFGIIDGLPTLCRLLLDNETVEESAFTQFELTGTIQSSKRYEFSGGQEIICECMSVTKKKLQDLIEQGVNNLDELSIATGAGTSCRGCVPKILQILGINPWLFAVMKKIKMHNSYISSFILKPINTHFNSFKPGQHVIIQVKIGEVWIERPYTISDIQHNGDLRVTIKNEPNGFFTQWLYENVEEEFNINVTQPQGNFLLNLESKNQILCFAGGIGITPFVTFAKALVQNYSNKRMHLLYSALTKSDFIETDEFNEITKKIPSFTVTYRASNIDGLLTEDEIIKLVNSFDEPDVYICGPEGFTSLIDNTLKKIQYNPNKIHIEQFVHAGSPQKNPNPVN